MLRRLVALSLLVSLAPLPALADPTKAELTQARKLFEEAQANEQEGQWLDALDQLRRILAIKETAGVRFHMALSEQHLGQLLGAQADFQRSSELARKMNNDEGRALMDRCASELGALRQRIPHLTIQVQASPGLQVDLDGLPLEEGRRNRPLDREVGEAIVRARAPGKQTFERRVQLAEGTNLTIAVVLEDVPRAVVPPAASSSAAPELPPFAVSNGTGAVLPWVAGGVSMLSGTAGIFFLINRNRLRRETDDICQDPNYVCDRQTREDRIGTYRTASIAAGGLWLLSTGMMIYLATSASNDPPTVSLHLAPRGASVAAHW
jgi:hypothetical protein